MYSDSRSQSLLEQLVEALRCLPGVGPKSAQRMALHLLERNREGGVHLASVLEAAMERIGRCGQCRNLTEDEASDIARRIFEIFLKLHEPEPQHTSG